MTDTAISATAEIELARRHYQAGDVAGTEAICRAVLEDDPDNAEAWNLFGIASCALGRHEPGQAAFRRALLLDGGRADIHMNLGNALREGGDAGRAEQSLRNAIALEPAYAEAHYNLALALQQQGRGDEARRSCLHALQLNADFGEAYLVLGALLQEVGHKAEAIESYRQALRCNPQLIEAWRSLAALLEAESRLDEAVACCRRALELAPDDGETLYMLGLLLDTQGYTAEAGQFVSRAMKRVPRQAAVEMSVTLATMVPPIARSREEIVEVRRRLSDRLDTLAAANLRFDADVATFAPPFFLSYHGLANRELHLKFAGLLERMSPGLAWTAPHCQRWTGPGARIKVGFISRFLHNHSIGKTTRGFFPHLDRARFDAYALFLPPAVDDETARFIRQHAEHSVDLPEGVAAARERIAALELDVLFYQDVAMEALSHRLCFARLAPVQCLSFGHPDTTGVRNMDYFVSSDLFEPAEAQAHYSERLFLLRDLGTLAYYEQPRPPQPLRTRAQLGLPSGARLYVCPQTLFKLHPDVDALFAGILRGDPQARIVLIEGKVPQWAHWLRQRFARTLPGGGRRVQFLRQMGREEFLSLLAAADVVLDTPHFGGMNTTLEALAMGTPVVTLPGEFQRGRHASGMYRRMGIDDCVAGSAADYIAIALRLGTDPGWRAQVIDRIVERRGALFADARVVREFERFFTEAVAEARARSGGAAPAALLAERDARAAAANERGIALAEEKRYADAEAAYREALDLAGESAIVLTNLANVLGLQERYEEALVCCERALAVEPGYEAARVAFATTCCFMDRWDEALDAFRGVIETNPRSLPAHNNMGIALLALRRLDEAARAFDAVLEIEPDNHDGHWNRACLLLLKGDYERGWREYEWRWTSPSEMREQAGRIRQPRWRGGEAAGRTILVHTEQGFGDTIQFVRYASLLAGRGAKVMLSCPAPLERLLAGADGVAGVLPQRDVLAFPFDLHCPLMSAPLVLGTTLDSVPAAVPYIRPAPALVEAWRRRIPDGEGLKVGLTWSSNAHRYHEFTVVRSKRSKSCPTALLARFAGIPGVRFFSLQKDTPPDIAELALPLVDLMPEAADFADTAALMMHLDLVISVDTSVAHLAGALGRPVWVLLMFDCDWRWLLEREDSPWYPTARLFRQRRMGDWSQVIDEAAGALEGLAGRRLQPGTAGPPRDRRPARA